MDFFICSLTCVDRMEHERQEPTLFQAVNSNIKPCANDGNVIECYMLRPVCTPCYMLLRVGGSCRIPVRLNSTAKTDATMPIIQGSYSFELFKFRDFFHDLFQFSKTLGLVVTFKNVHNFRCLGLFFDLKQFNRHKLRCPPKCVPFAPLYLNSPSNNFI